MKIQNTTKVKCLFTLLSVLLSNMAIAQAMPADINLRTAFEATVEPNKQAVLAAEVGGKVSKIYVRAGDFVKQGQLLVSLDARASNDNANAASAQLAAASAQANLASKELHRKQQLFAQQYISQAALDQANAAYAASNAQVAAYAAQAKAAKTAASYQSITAPFSGQISAVQVEVGDLAYAGRPIISINTPNQLKVVSHLPVAVAKQNLNTTGIQVISGATNQWVALQNVQVLPSVNAQNLTQEVLFYIANPNNNIAVGQYAKVWVLGAASGQNKNTLAKKMYVPASSIIKRGDLTAVYVVNSKGEKSLRQVRVGQVVGASIEVLSGVSLGERVVIKPQ